MIDYAFRMAKASMKLLLRNKGFFVVGFVIPIVATFMLNIWYGNEESYVTDTVYELQTMDAQMAYLDNMNCLPVKVYDRCFDQYSTGVCNDLTEAGLFQVFRVDAREYSMDDITKSAADSAKNDKVGAVVILEKEPENTKLFRVGEDERFDLLRDTLELCLKTPSFSEKVKPSVTYVSVASGKEVNYYKTREFSYCVAIATIAFIFGGVLILGVILAEKQDHVLSRIMLTKVTRTHYILSKIILVLGVTVIQTAVMMICFQFLVKVNIGMNVWQFAFILFLEGIIFSFFSVCAGMFCNSMSAAAFLAFTTWSMSALLAGTYFDISGAGELYKKISIMMPQRWALISATRLINGDRSGYPLIMCATMAYLLIILVVGIIGLKFAEEE